MKMNKAMQKRLSIFSWSLPFALAIFSASVALAQAPTPTPTSPSTTIASEPDSTPPAEPAALTQQISDLQRAEAVKQDKMLRERMREVLASPDFSSEETMKVPSLKKKSNSGDGADWMKYFERFGRFVARFLRAAVWILGGIAVLVLLYFVHRWWRVAGSRAQVDEVAIPTHVGALDIRAASLPDDVGAAARVRWQAGDVTGSLSLLYRGALSALVLRFEAHIRSSFTEAECLRAGKVRLSAASYLYFESLTRAWLQAVYAGRRPDDTTALALCDDFAAHFPSGTAPLPVTGAMQPDRRMPA
ncbi:MAG: hypothetical protein ABI905_11135 [Betaproteobacteria bacterium]